MAARANEAAGVGSEGVGRELARRTFWAKRVLARGPQDVRYATTRYFGIGCVAMSGEEIQRDMRISPEEFEELWRRGIRSLREADTGERGWTT